METTTAIELLVRILTEPERRSETIRAFQEMVFNATPTREDEGIIRFLNEVAYDLDFYEEDPRVRAEDLPTMTTRA